MSLNDLQLDKYLKRINFSQPIKRNGETLRALQHAHITSIPYENLDILRKIPLSLKPEDLYKKIVENGRGGYCFELNALFGSLLSGLGFNVTNYFARFLKNEQEIPVRRHHVLKVEANDGVFLCDVGVGIEAPRYSLKLIEAEEQSDEFAKYKLTREPFLGWIIWQYKNGDQWSRFFSFTEEPQLGIDYIMPSFYCEMHVDSPFNKEPMLSIKTESGRKTIDGKQFKVFEGDKMTDTYILENDESFLTTLKEHFNITLSTILI